MTAFRVLDVAELEGRRKPVARELGARAVKLNQFDSQPRQEGLLDLLADVILNPIFRSSIFPSAWVTLSFP